MRIAVGILYELLSGSHANDVELQELKPGSSYVSQLLLNPYGGWLCCLRDIPFSAFWLRPSVISVLISSWRVPLQSA
jgi:hypothetical protein